MTEEEKKAMLDSFRKAEKPEEPDPWTHEDIAEVAQKILERMRRNGEKV